MLLILPTHKDAAGNRGRFNLTIETVARALHCSMATVSLIERGRSTNRETLSTYRDYLASQQITGCAI